MKPFEPRRSARALVVDDDPSERETLAEALREAGLQVEEASDVRESMRCVNGTFFDAIVCEVVLPDMTGLELLEWLRRVLPLQASRVVLMSRDIDDFGDEPLRVGAPWLDKASGYEAVVQVVQDTVQSEELDWERAESA